MASWKKSAITAILGTSGKNKKLKPDVEWSLRYRTDYRLTTDGIKISEMIRKMAPTKKSALVTGQSGTSKELVSWAILALGSYTGNCFLAVNRVAIPKSLLESELFGHNKGGCTSAMRAYEREHICRILNKHHWNKTDTAKVLSNGFSSLYQKIDELEIHARRKKPSKAGFD